MKYKRPNEVIELPQSAWQKGPDLNLLQFLQKLTKESGFDGKLADLTDDILVYHLKIRDSAEDAVIPGSQKDYGEDFKTALLHVRDVTKEGKLVSGITEIIVKGYPSPFVVFSGWWDE